MGRYWRTAGVLAMALLVQACLVTPGKFVSALDIRADRSFTFSYTGEIIASDMGKDMGDGISAPADDAAPEGKDSAYYSAILFQGDKPAKTPAPDERFDDSGDDNDDAKMQAIATALTKEKGFRSVRYLGNHRFEIDYAIAGTLDHAFLFPFNIDAQIVLPFVAVELRGDDRVRMKAPGYANSSDKSQGPMMGSGGPGEEAAQALNGTFTLTTDAEIVSQNQEDGAIDTPRGKQISWTITPLTSEAPAATLRLRPR